MKKKRFSSKSKFSKNKDKTVWRPQKKKALGQHFLRRQSVVDHMIDKVSITDDTSVLEIGCGDGFLTQSILFQTPCKRLWCFEIDSQWASFVEEKISDKRLTIKRQDILAVDIEALKKYKQPWVLLANLPYQITFPFFSFLVKHKDIFVEGVVMVQEEVAQKIVAKKGRNYGIVSLILQYHFEFTLMDKIDPSAFTPSPKVYSRLIYFKPKKSLTKIPQFESFWRFVGLCFKQPRRTIKNNLASTNYDTTKIVEFLKLRAQQLTFDNFLTMWKKII